MSRDLIQNCQRFGETYCLGSGLFLTINFPGTIRQKVVFMTWYDMIYLYDIYDTIWYDIWYDIFIWYIWYDIWYDMIYDMMIWYIFNCNLGWHPVAGTVHTNNTRNTQNGTYITIKKIYRLIWEVRAVPRLWELYPGICLTNEEKARKNLS
jgi:hypothetical protein